MRLISALPIALAALSLAACSSRDDAGGNEEAQEAKPAPVLTTQPQPTEAADGTKLTPGKWEVSGNATSVQGVYAEPGSTPSVVFACAREPKEMTLTVAGNASKDETYILEAGEIKVGLMMAPKGDGTVSASVDQTQPIFAALADPTAMLTISGPDMETLRIPGRQALSRVINACF